MNQSSWGFRNIRAGILDCVMVQEDDAVLPTAEVTMGIRALNFRGHIRMGNVYPPLSNRHFWTCVVRAVRVSQGHCSPTWGHWLQEQSWDGDLFKCQYQPVLLSTASGSSSSARCWAVLVTGRVAFRVNVIRVGYKLARVAGSFISIVQPAPSSHLTWRLSMRLRGIPGQESLGEVIMLWI